MSIWAFMFRMARAAPRLMLILMNDPHQQELLVDAAAHPPAAQGLVQPRVRKHHEALPHSHPLLAGTARLL